MNLTAREAGEAAAAAGARKLMLTHFWPGNDRDRSRAAAAEAFPGEILTATRAPSSSFREHRQRRSSCGATVLATSSSCRASSPSGHR